ncbi:MAG: bactofilin family protein [Polynucleobacter sp.]
MSETNQQGCLFVGEGVLLKGSFEVPDIASISGTIEGDISAKKVIVEQTGIIRGKLTGETVDIRGEVVEYLSSTQSLIIRSTGKVSGAIHYSEIEIEKGGHIYGDLHLVG